MVLSEELCILSSCFLSPMSKNSVLEELRVRRLAVNVTEKLLARNGLNSDPCFSGALSSSLFYNSKKRR